MNNRTNKDLQIYVGNFSDDVNEEYLGDVFQDFGLLNISLLYPEGKPRFAYLDLDCEWNIRRAYRDMNGCQIFGLNLVVHANNQTLQAQLEREFAPPGKGQRSEFHKQISEDLPPSLEVAVSNQTVSRQNIDHLQIYVGNIPNDVNEESLADLFQRFGLLNMRFLMPGIKRYAFLDLDCEKNVCRAVQEMHECKLNDNTLVVRAQDPILQTRLMKESECRSKRLTSETPARGRPLRSTDPLLEELPPPLEVAFSNLSVQDPAIEDCIPTTLVVANFPWGTTEEELLFLFQKFHPLKVSIIVNTRLPDPRERTYAYVTLPTRKLAELAIVQLDEYVFKKQTLLVTCILERIIANN